MSKNGKKPADWKIAWWLGLLMLMLAGIWFFGIIYLLEHNSWLVRWVGSGARRQRAWIFFPAHLLFGLGAGLLISGQLILDAFEDWTWNPFEARIGQWLGAALVAGFTFFGMVAAHHYLATRYHGVDFTGLYP